MIHHLLVQHNGASYEIDFDTDDGLEVLKYQLFSLTLMPPEDQKIIDISGKPIIYDSDLSNLSLSNGCTLSLLKKEDEADSSASISAQDLAAIAKADEELARLLQLEEDSLYIRQQQQGESGRAEFQQKIESYLSQVLQYEDSLRQEAARRSIPLQDLEEKAVVALAKEGKRNASDTDMKHALLLQLLLWFKQSFRWVNAPSCTSCGAATVKSGMGNPTVEELRFGANRVEIYRCQRCSRLTRFPRYNDPIKLIETQSGRCGEWANCFTLYCRALGYQARLVLDFTDHVWTECFSDLLGCWVHLDPCEAVFNKPLLYEQGWGKKLNYVIALANDGAYDVTKRYTRKWDEVLLRRNLTSEQNVKEVITHLTAKIRSTLPRNEVQALQERDKQEAEEIQKSIKDYTGPSEVLPGRQSGATEWRMIRGEMGVTELTVSNRSRWPVRLCVDDHVSTFFKALGCFCADHCEKKESVHSLDSAIKAFYEILLQLKAAPYKVRQVKVNLEPGSSPWYETIGAGKFQGLLQALGLKKRVDNVEVWICVDEDLVETALALPVAIEQLESLRKMTETSAGLESGFNRLRLLSENERVCGGYCQASGEEPPLGIATSAFDGLHSTKWEEPDGAKGCWITYYLPAGVIEQVTAYEFTIANDCPERDPKDWVLEGSNDGGCTWNNLDTRNAEYFGCRFERRTFKIASDKQLLCNALRWKFLYARDPSATSRLQIACIDCYRRKS